MFQGDRDLALHPHSDLAGRCDWCRFSKEKTELREVTSLPKFMAERVLKLALPPSEAHPLPHVTYSLVNDPQWIWS